MKNLLRKNPVQISILLIILSLLFLYITPKVSRTVFPALSSNSWDNFQQSIQSGQIDPQEYWKFREFYSPGVFTVDKQGINSESIRTFYSSLPNELQNQPELIFSKFKSPRFKSIDGLSNKSSIEEIVNLEEINKSQIIKQTNTVFLYKVSDKKYVLIALFTPKQMKQANGFWDYQKDQEIINNRNWISTSVISLP